MYHSELTSKSVTFGYSKDFTEVGKQIAASLNEALEGRAAMIMHDLGARLISVTAPNNKPFSRAEIGNILTIAAEQISNERVADET